MADARLWRANVDGGCHPNPEGVMGLGVVLTDPDGKVVAEISERPPRLGTNNEAEYLAVLRALQTALDHDARDLEVAADSRLTVNTLAGLWQVKAVNLIPLKALIDQERRHFRTLRFRWIPREENKHADRLATEAIGGTVGSGSKYGKAEGSPVKPAAERPLADGALCGLCKKMTKLSWQRFGDGSAHIRQECPEHGFLRFAPKEKVFLDLLGPPPK